MTKKLYIVGFGPGDYAHMTQSAIEVMGKVDVIVGYTTYVEMVKPYFPEQTYLVTPMKQERKRCLMAIEEVLSGKDVALISSGDSGVYGMAGIALQLVQEMENPIEVEVIPGVTASCMAASVLGAPLMHDFATISLSDLMTPLDLIYKRVECCAMGDMILALYNPRSKKRSDYIIESAKLVLQYQEESVPVGIVRHAGRNEQEVMITTLGELSRFAEWEDDKKAMLDMFSLVIIGNSTTYVKDGKMITPRGYEL